MILWRLSVLYLLRRWGSALLTVVVGALGIGLLATVMTLATSVPAAVKTAFGGADMVVGPKGSELDLVLCCALQVTPTRGLMSFREARAAVKNPYIRTAVPVALGDSYDGARILWTRPDIAGIYDARLAQGRMFAGPLEAVIGAQAARQRHIRIGDSLVSTHGLEAGGERHDHAAYRVVGILQPTGAVIDRVILSDLSSIARVHGDHDNDDHGPDHDSGQVAGAGYDAAGDPLAISAMLVRFASPIAAAIVPRQISMETSLTAASPQLELARLSALVRPLFNLMTVFGVVFGIVAALMAALGLATALNQRTRDLALLRVLGASRLKVARIALQEALILAHIAFALGVAATFALGAVAAGRFLDYGLLIHIAPDVTTGLGLYAGTMIAALAASVVPIFRVLTIDGEAVLKA